MSIAESILPEFDHEMAGTRKVLERVPDDKLDWKAHPKSNSIRWVASHLVQIVYWGEVTLTQASFDVHPVGGEPHRTQMLENRQAILESFDKNVAAARKALASISDADILQPWSLLRQGQPVMTMPRVALIRSFVLNHSIHHRAILTVYLRLNDVAVPGLYGPSGDEG